MADKTIESIYASAIVIDEAYVTTSGSASEIDMTAALAAQAASSAAALVGPPRAALGETSEEWSARVRSMTRDERRAAADSTCAPLEAAALAVSAGITQAARTVIDPRNGDAVRIVLTRFKPGTPEHGANIDGAASVNDRASIVAFLTAEAKRFDEAARGISAESSYSTAVSHIHERLVTRASLCRTLAAQIERGDDRQGGE